MTERPLVKARVAGKETSMMHSVKDALAMQSKGALVYKATQYFQVNNVIDGVPAVYSINGTTAFAAATLTHHQLTGLIRCPHDSKIAITQLYVAASTLFCQPDSTQSYGASYFCIWTGSIYTVNNSFQPNDASAPPVAALIFNYPNYIIPVSTAFVMLPVNIHLDKHSVTMAFLTNVPPQGSLLNPAPASGLPFINFPFQYGEGVINIETY